MKILLTGSTGYIGKRLLPLLINRGYEVTCCVRDLSRFNPPAYMRKNISIIRVDLTDNKSLDNIPKNIDVAFYLVHSMSTSDNYEKLEQKSAINFREQLSKTTIKHVIYLSGIINQSSLSKHLLSRKLVENELKKGNYNFTTFRAGIIIGSGSASFEIMRDLVEKLPIMIAPRWLLTKCQPIAIFDVLTILSKSIMNEDTFDKNFDIGSNDILTYKEMLLGIASTRKLKRVILTFPVMSPRISSYWLYFVTSTSYRLAKNLVDSMKVEVVCENNKINDILNIEPITYKNALTRAFEKIEKNDIISSWKDSYSSSGMHIDISEFISVPEFGVFRDLREISLIDYNYTLNKIWKIGGENGWYFGNWLWRLRGFIDKLVGGVGLRRGRTNKNYISAGDSLDFWRVLYADKKEGKLLLFAEMKLPGEAWLEFKLSKNKLNQTATFRPKGLLGRLYWISVYPFHGYIFNGLIKKLVNKSPKN
tara:strand:- start:240 stop:1670 length:1431 start_codon:yes stop_codon:yes gene_type:complete